MSTYANAASKGAQTNTIPDAVPRLRFTNNSKPKTKGKKKENNNGSVQQQKEKPKERIYIEPERQEMHKSIVASFPEPDTANAGLFQRFDRDLAYRLAFWTGADVCALGATCKYLKRVILTPKILKLVGRYPEVQRPIVKIKLYMGTLEADSDDEEIIVNSVQALPIQSFGPESRIAALANNWLSLAKDAQDSRDKQLEAEKKRDIDPNSYKKPTLHIDLEGGIFFESLLDDKKSQPTPASNSRVAPNKLFNTENLPNIVNWLEGLSLFLAGQSEVVLKHSNGDVKLQRTGGGNCIKLSWKDENGPRDVSFPLSRFSLNFRTSAKDYLRVIARVIQYLRQRGENMTIPQNESRKEEAENEKRRYTERERLIVSNLHYSRILGYIKDIKNLLRAGAISGAELGKYFARRKEEKARFKKQMELEYNDMNAFILSNLPKDLSIVESLAVKLTDAERTRVQDRKKAEEDRRKANDAFRQQAMDKQEKPAKKKGNCYCWIKYQKGS